MERREWRLDEVETPKPEPLKVRPFVVDNR